jgi:hypothetical protein
LGKHIRCEASLCVVFCCFCLFFQVLLLLLIVRPKSSRVWAKRGVCAYYCYYCYRLPL